MRTWLGVLAIVTASVASAGDAIPELKTVTGPGVSVRVPTTWSVDARTGGFVIPDGPRRGMAGALLSEAADRSLEAFLRDLEPSIVAAQMQRRSIDTRTMDGGERTDVEYGRGTSSPVLTLSGVLTTSGPRALLAFCGSTPERRPTGEEVCAPILASVGGATANPKAVEPGRTTGDGWSVVLPKGWKEQPVPNGAPKTFVSPQAGIAPVFLQIQAKQSPARGEEDARRFLASYFEGSPSLSITPTRLGDVDAVTFRGSKVQEVDPAFALLRLISKRGRRVGVLCLASTGTERPLCEAVIASVKFTG